MTRAKHIRVDVERESVCAGDDIDAPHSQHFTLPAATTLEQALATIRQSRYLPGISSGNATWIVESDRPLAVIGQQWDHPAFLIDATTPVVECLGTPARPLRFRYWCQVDPAVVLCRLKSNSPLPDRYGRSE